MSDNSHQQYQAEMSASPPGSSAGASSMQLMAVGGGGTKSAAELSIEEQQIIAEIQELQRKLRTMKTEQSEEVVEEVRHRRILIVANRLPIHASRDPRTARWKFQDAPGGLATALRGINMEVDFVWVGWVGCDVPVSERSRVTERLMREHSCYPVYLDSKLMDKYYNGFCNDVLWPLFHYVPLPMYQAGAEKKFDASLWEAYKEANKYFADAICRVYDDGSEQNDSVEPATPVSPTPPDAANSTAGQPGNNTKKPSGASSSSSSSAKAHAAACDEASTNPSPSGKRQRSVAENNTEVRGSAEGKNGVGKKKGASTQEGSSTKKKAGDLVWVHDYHLMRIPLELRRREPRMPVAWFLHTPFPSSEIYRILPFRKELLEGLLHADLVGFHTYDYARHFLSACSRVLDLTTTTPKGIEFGGRFCSIGVFPIGIDPQQITTTLASKPVAKRVRELGDVFQGRKIIIGVDRLDYIKGMPHKLLAFELFLARYPEWIGKVTLIQVGVPTRTEVEEYRSLAKHVNELVGRINGVYGTLEYAPIHYINQSIPQEELIAIYHLADACLVTSVRDGMNLVSHEYVAAQADLLRNKRRRRFSSKSTDNLVSDDDDDDSDDDDFDDEGDDEGREDEERRGREKQEEDDEQKSPRLPARKDKKIPFAKDGPGVLVLSEFAGSAQSLSGAIRVNPWNTDELATAMHDALTMSRVERELRWGKLDRYVATNTASYWGRSFVTEFGDVCDHPPLLSNLPRLPTFEVLKAYEKAKHRLIVADYDGTLTQIQSLPQLATPAPIVTQLLSTLARDPKNTLYVMSGRERRFMDKWLGKLRVGLAAEFGLCYRGPDDPPGEWSNLGSDLDTSWKDVVRPIMQYFAERTPGTYIESKESSLAWHYRDADPHFGAWQAKDMQIHMEDVLANQPLEIIQGNRLVEVRHVGVNKSLVLEVVLKKGPPQPRTGGDGGRGDGTLARTLSDPPAGNAPPSSSQQEFAQQQPHAIQMAEEVPEATGEDYDFILCVGDDRSDEDMYQLLKAYYASRLDGQMASTSTPKSATTTSPPAPSTKPLALYLVHIGTGATQAEFYLESIFELRKIIRGMASISLRDARFKASTTTT